MDPGRGGGGRGSRQGERDDHSGKDMEPIGQGWSQAGGGG